MIDCSDTNKRLTDGIICRRKLSAGELESYTYGDGFVSVLKAGKETAAPSIGTNSVMHELLYLLTSRLGPAKASACPGSANADSILGGRVSQSREKPWIIGRSYLHRVHPPDFNMLYIFSVDFLHLSSNGLFSVLV